MAPAPIQDGMAGRLRLDDSIEGVLAEQIVAKRRLDDLDFQMGEVQDLLTQVLAPLEPSDEGGCQLKT